MKKIFPHIFVVFGFMFIFSLGVWQTQRLAWKNEIINKIDQRLNAQPISLDQYKNIESDEFKQIKLVGKFDYSKEIKLLNRTYNGKPGVHVFTPFKEASGQIILVDRGFVKYEEDYEKPTGKQEVVGVIRAGQKQNWITLDNEQNKNFFVWVELPLFYKLINAPEKNFYVDLKEGAKTKLYPIALPKKIEVYNEHLQYAITWYSLSIAFLAVYYFRFWHKKDKQDKKTKKKKK